jgi:acetoin utilization deacetylase AcuC-like enzyme
MRLVWSGAYEVDLFGHVFPVTKYRLIKEALLEQGIAQASDFSEARPAAAGDLLLVHTPEYVDDLLSLRWSHRTMRSELALTREIVDAYVTSAGGTLQAARFALEDGICVHIGGGFHHAYADHAEGFCYVNDVAVAVERLRHDRLVEKIVIIDCDLHQGNGTAFIFGQDPAVFTFSIHQENNYPPKERSDLDIGLPDGAGDDLYLAELSIIGQILDHHSPDMVFYLAGADPFAGDQLGGLTLSQGGLKERDIFVFAESRRRGLPVCVVLAGGYAYNIKDVVEIHVTTIVEARRTWAGKRAC